MLKILCGLIIIFVFVGLGSASLQELFGTKVYVNTTPAGAELSFDGMQFGNTPITVTGIQAGIHEIFLNEEGYQDYRTSIEIGKERKYTIYVSLTPLSVPQRTVQETSAVAVSPTPEQVVSSNNYYTTADLDASLSGAVVLINPPTIQPTPVPTPTGPRGNIKNIHQDKSSEGSPSNIHGNTAESSNVPAGKGIQSLKDTGTFSIDSFPSGAEVFIDGINAGSTPLAVTDLPAGAHDVTLSLKGYDSFTSPVNINPQTLNVLSQGKTIQLKSSMMPGGFQKGSGHPNKR